MFFFFFFFNDTATTEIYTLSLHDALPILQSKRAMIRANPLCRLYVRVCRRMERSRASARRQQNSCSTRSEEHTSELQSQSNLVCRLLLEKKKKQKKTKTKNDVAKS